MVKGLKAVKGAKTAAVDDDEFSAVTKKTPVKKDAGKGKKKRENDESEEEVVEVGLAPATTTPNDKPVKPKVPKRPKVQKIDLEDLPEGKIELPATSSAADALDADLAAMDAEDSAED